ncbi:PRC-barrel domain-containing protein [Bradyrhizobium icense]|nr:PRC-barrel domain-containing protein [Bradyrhizobium icense]
MRQTQRLLLTTATILIGFSAGGAAAVAQAERGSAGKGSEQATQRGAQGQPSAEASRAGDQLKRNNQREQSAQRVATDSDAPPVILLRDWGYDRIYGEGWSARRLMDDATVYGPNGNEIGSVENLIIGRDGALLGIVAEVGGFLNIGDTHVFVPWDHVRVSDGLKRVTLPVTEDNIENYSTSPDGYLQKSETGARQIVQEELSSGPRIWKASEILEDEAVLNGFVRYGSVSDLIFTSDAQLHAVVVSPYAAYRGGYRAFPYYGYAYGWAPWYPAYHLGYNRDDVVNLQVLDYDRIRNEPGSGGQAASKRGGGDGTTGSAAEPRKQQNVATNGSCG